VYGLIVSMRTQPGRRDEVIALLLRGIDELAALGCVSYVVCACTADPERIWVTEVWASKDHHAASLELPETKAAIAAAMPLLTGEFTTQELRVLGGLGLRDLPASR
jgi:quinol monooxygenase YgiN